MARRAAGDARTITAAGYPFPNWRAIRKWEFVLETTVTVAVTVPVTGRGSALWVTARRWVLPAAGRSCRWPCPRSRRCHCRTTARTGPSLCPRASPRYVCAAVMPCRRRRVRSRDRGVACVLASCVAGAVALSCSCVDPSGAAVAFRYIFRDVRGHVCTAGGVSRAGGRVGCCAARHGAADDPYGAG